MSYLEVPTPLATWMNKQKNRVALNNDDDTRYQLKASRESTSTIPTHTTMV